MAIAVMFLVTGGSAIHWLARPHLFTLLFTVIFYSILERVKDGQVRLLWCLPALMVVWTNVHGGFFVGIILVGAYAAGEIAQWAVYGRCRSAAAGAPPQHSISGDCRRLPRGNLDQSVLLSSAHAHFRVPDGQV